MSDQRPLHQARRTLLTALLGILIATGTAGVANAAGGSPEQVATSTRAPQAADAAPCWDPASDATRVVAGAIGTSTTPCMVPPAGEGNTLPEGYAPRVDRTVLDIRYGPDPQQQLDLYLPRKSPAPVIVFFHAGGWVSGNRKGVAASALEQVRRGYAVASVEYRLAPEVRFPVPLQDAKTTIRWVKAHGSEYGIRADKVIASGASAGGHLAAMVAVTDGLFEPVDLPADLAAQNSRVSAAVSMVGPLDLNALGQEVGTWGPGLVSTLLDCPTPRDDQPATCSREAMAAASPINYVTRDDPPIYLSYGANDVLVPPSTNGLVMATGYAQLGRRLEARFDLVQNQGHNVDFDGLNITMLNRFLDWNRDGVLV